MLIQPGLVRKSMSGIYWFSLSIPLAMLIKSHTRSSLYLRSGMTLVGYQSVQNRQDRLPRAKQLVQAKEGDEAMLRGVDK
jgi:hypothetical protein